MKNLSPTRFLRSGGHEGSVEEDEGPLPNLVLRSGDYEASVEEDEGPQPNPSLEAGKTLPRRYGDFPPELYGKPIEDIDDFYDDKFVSFTAMLYQRWAWIGLTNWLGSVRVL